MPPLSDLKAQGGGKLNPAPVNVLAAVSPILCHEYIRTELLPYLALGFTPVYTSAVGRLCAIHALATGLRAVKEALGIPPNPRGHVSVKGLQRQLASPKWTGKVTEHIDKNIPGLDRNSRDQHIADLSAESVLDVTQIHLLLQLVNEEEKTNFCLGVVTRGYVTKKKVVPTNVQILNDGSGTQPVIWLYNDNSNAKFKAIEREDVEEAKTQGASGITLAAAYKNLDISNHWEAFAIPSEDVQEEKRRKIVRDWNFGPEIVEDVTRGVWRTTTSNIGEQVPVNGLLYDRGQFLRETPAPPRTVIPEGFLYMVSPAHDSDQSGIGLRRRGLVPETDIVRIELHPKAPTEPVDLCPTPPVVEGLFRIYRGVAPAHKFGGTSPRAEVPVRNGFNIRAGEFLYDLQQRDGIWIKVRKVDGSEGWAYPRTIEQLKFPWDLPAHIPCLPNGKPIQYSENNQKSLDEANKWGFANNIDKEMAVDFLKRFDRAEYALPFGVLAKPHESGEVKFSKGEMVFKASEISASKTIKIVNYQGQRVIVPLDIIAPIDPVWGLAVSAKELKSILAHVSARKLIKGIELDLGKHIADLELKSSPVVVSGGKRSSEGDGNLGSAEKKRKREEEQKRDESQMSVPEVVALRRRERLEAAERRREAQTKKGGMI